MPFSGPDGAWRKGPTDWSNYLPILGWKIVYTDGSVFTSKMGTWSQAPRENVGLIMVHHKGHYRTCIDGHDEYMLKGETETKLGGMVGGELDGPEWQVFYDKWFNA